VSGTAHEIERTSEAREPVHVYFSDEPIDRKAIDLKELARLDEFRTEMEAKGLVAEYADPTSLGYQVREAVEHDLTRMNLGVTALPIAAPPNMPCRGCGMTSSIRASSSRTSATLCGPTLEMLCRYTVLRTSL
jgi:hypothetical protein